LAISDARRRANAKYNAKAYENIPLRVKTGQKSTIKAHANSQSESVNGFINRAIDETMLRDNEAGGKQ
jgi:hypothetical protein